MAEDIYQFLEKTEPPTPRKLQKAKQEGWVFRSKEVVDLLVVVMMAVFLMFYVPYLRLLMNGVMVSGLNLAHPDQFSNAWLCAGIYFVISKVGYATLPVFIFVLVAMVASHALQSGFIFTMKPFSRGFGNLSLGKNWRAFFSQENFIKALLQTLKIIALLGVLGWNLVTWKNHMNFGDSNFTAQISGFVWPLLMQGGLVVVVFALVDFFYGRFCYQKSLWMTRYEVREEQRETEGDPRVRTAALQTWQSLMQQHVVTLFAECKLIVTDGQIIAIALSVDRLNRQWQVEAKLEGEHVKRVLETAQTAHVSVVNDGELARVLYKEEKVKTALSVSVKKSIYEYVKHLGIRF